MADSNGTSVVDIHTIYRAVNEAKLRGIGIEKTLKDFGISRYRYYKGCKEAGLKPWNKKNGTFLVKLTKKTGSSTSNDDIDVSKYIKHPTPKHNPISEPLTEIPEHDDDDIVEFLQRFSTKAIETLLRECTDKSGKSTVQRALRIKKSLDVSDPTNTYPKYTSEKNHAEKKDTSDQPDKRQTKREGQHKEAISTPQKVTYSKGGGAKIDAFEESLCGYIK